MDVKESNKSTEKKSLSLGDIIDELIDILSSKEKFCNYFKADRDTFFKIKENLDEGVIRVGLIGITSSGKSTLINALLGEYLLPQKVKPSSNILVVCGYEKIKKATIFFEEESNKPRKDIYNDISKTLEKYGDEQYNPGNKHQVKEIRVGTPNFKLSKSILLVDSPGLDAYGMGLHEKITLQLALPTLDLVLYLTTVKASSDKENLSRIDEISTEGKPLIVVQNMIDSIEPKIIKGGIVAKDKRKIREEHYERLKNLLSRGKNNSTKSANIIQVSALQALSSKIAESNVEELFKVVTNIEERLKKNQEFDRANQLTIKINELIKNLSRVVGYDFDHEEKVVRDLNEEFRSTLDSDFLSANTVIEDFGSYKNNVISKINNSDSEDEINAVVSAFSSKKEILENDLSVRIKKNYDDILVFAKKVNITSQDLRIAITNLQNISTIHVPTKIQSKKIKRNVRKEGMTGSVSRFFGSFTGNKEWGYKSIEETVIWSEIDKRTLVQTLNTVYESWENWYPETLKKFDEQRKGAIEKIKEEIELKKISIDDKKSNTILNTDKNELIFELEKIVVQLKRKIPDNNQNVQTYRSNNGFTHVGEQALTDQPRAILNIFKLAHINSYYPLRAIRNFCLEKFNSKSILIWGWDNNDLCSFTNLFFLSPEPVIDKNFSIVLDTDIGEISFVNENNFRKDNHNVVLKNFRKTEVTIFVNVDLSQLGLLEKKLHESILKEMPKKKIIWVIQGVDILLQNDSLIEAIVGLSNYLDRINVTNSLFLVASKDPFYSFLVNELLNIGDINTFLLADERVIIDKIGKNREEEVGKYIKQYVSEQKREYARICEN